MLTLDDIRHTRGESKMVSTSAMFGKSSILWQRISNTSVRVYLKSLP